MAKLVGRGADVGAYGVMEEGVWIVAQFGFQ